MSEPKPAALSVGRVAQLLSVSEWAVRRLIRSGKLPAFVVGKSYRIAVVDLQAFRQRQRVQVE